MMKNSRNIMNITTSDAVIGDSDISMMNSSGRTNWRKKRKRKKPKGHDGEEGDMTSQSISFTVSPAHGIRIRRIATEDDPVYPSNNHNNKHSHHSQPHPLGNQSIHHTHPVMSQHPIHHHSHPHQQQPKVNGDMIEMIQTKSSGIQNPAFIEDDLTQDQVNAIRRHQHLPSTSSRSSITESFSSCYEDSAIDANNTNTDTQSDSPVNHSGNSNNNNNGLQKCRCLSNAASHFSSGSSVIPGITLVDHDDDVIETAVRIRKVNLSYKEKVINAISWSGATQPVFVLNGISMTVPRAAIYGLLGPSGCGKTSLLRCIMGLVKPESGSITVFGYKPGTSGSGVPGPGVGFMPQEIALHSDLTIHEMLTYFGRLYFIKKYELNDRIDMLLKVLDLPSSDRLISTLSGGQRRRVSFASALLHKPRLLILDEPTVGVDPVLREKIWNHLVKITKEDKTSVIITTHYIEETRRADIVGFMRKGVLLKEGAPDQIMSRYNATTLEEVFYKLCTVQKNDSLRPVTRDTLKMLRRQSIKNRKLTFHDPEVNLEEKKIPYSYPKYTNPTSRMVSQFHALMSKYMIQISRQPESVVGQFILPIMCLVMFCICIGGTPGGLPVAVINEEDPPYLSLTLLKSINPYILHQVNYTSVQAGIADVRKGKLWGVLHIRQNFSEAITQRIFFDENADDLTINASSVVLHADLTNKVLGITLDTVLVHTFEDFVQVALTEMGINPNIGRFPVQIGSTVYGEYSKTDFFGVRDFAAPGFLIVISFSVAYALTCLSLLVERLDDMFERNYSSGVSTTQIILSILSVRFVFVAVGTTILLTMGIFLFDVPCRGSFLAVLVMLLLQSIAGMCMGLCVSAVVPDFFICAAVSNGLLIFIFIISGVLWSLETLPYYIKWFSYVQPTTLPADSMRSMLTRGLSVTHVSVWPGFAVSVIWILILLMTASRIFKYQK